MSIEGESEDPDLVYQRICREIERLEKEEIDKKRFEIDKRVRYGEKISSINDVKACADAMLYYHMDCDDVTLFEDVDMIASLTAQECQQALPELFDIDKSSISIVTDKNDY